MCGPIVKKQYKVHSYILRNIYTLNFMKIQLIF